MKIALVARHKDSKIVYQSASNGKIIRTSYIKDILIRRKYINEKAYEEEHAQMLANWEFSEPTQEELEAAGSARTKATAAVKGE